MVVITSVDNVRVLSLAIESKVLFEGLLSAGFMAEDLFDRIRRGEGDVTVGVPDDRAITVVEVLQRIVPISSGEMIHVGQLGESVELRTWNLC